MKSDFTTDVTTTQRLFVDDDVTMNKRLFIVNDLSLGGNLLMRGTNSKITVFDLSINDDASVKGDLHVDGNLYANFADGSIPQSALEAGESSSSFTTDLATTKRAFVDEDMTLGKSLFLANDLSMGGRLFLGSQISKIDVYDLSVNDDASIKGDLHVDGNFFATNYADDSIPQSAIIGGVGSNVFTEDIQAGARAFVDEDVTFKKRLFIVNDLSLGGNVFMGNNNSKVTVFDLSVNDDASITGDLHVGGVFVANYSDNTIPQSAIIGGVGSNVFTEDISANKDEH